MTAPRNPWTPFYQDAKQWVEVFDIIGSAASALPDTDWSPEFGCKRVDSEEHRLHIRKSLSDIHRKEWTVVLDAIGGYFQAGSWPTLSPQQAYCLQRMFVTAGRYVRSSLIGSPDSARTMFSLPKLPSDRIVWWLLTEWWQQTGVQIWLDEATSDEVIFHRFFS
jgi:hypothetical protein